MGSRGGKAAPSSTPRWSRMHTARVSLPCAVGSECPVCVLAGHSAKVRFGKLRLAATVWRQEQQREVVQWPRLEQGLQVVSVPGIPSSVGALRVGFLFPSIGYWMSVSPNSSHIRVCF